MNRSTGWHVGASCFLPVCTGIRVLCVHVLIIQMSRLHPLPPPLPLLFIKLLDCGGGFVDFLRDAPVVGVYSYVTISRARRRVIGVERGELCSFVSIDHCVYCCWTSTTLCVSVRTMGAGRDDRLSPFFFSLWFPDWKYPHRFSKCVRNSNSGSGGVSSSFWFGWRGMLREFFWFTCVATTSSSSSSSYRAGFLKKIKSL